MDNLFSELKTLPFDKKYSFAVLLRTYLEQSLYFFIQENDLLGELSDKLSDDNKKNGQKKVDTLIKYIRDVHNIDKDIDSEKCMSILKFNSNKEYSDTSLKAMLPINIKT